MSYSIFPRSGSFHVYKVDQDNCPVGSPVSSWKNRDAARAALKELVNIERAKNALRNVVKILRGGSGSGFSAEAGHKGIPGHQGGSRSAGTKAKNNLDKKFYSGDLKFSNPDLSNQINTPVKAFVPPSDVKVSEKGIETFNTLNTRGFISDTGDFNYQNGWARGSPTSEFSAKMPNGKTFEFRIAPVIMVNHNSDNQMLTSYAQPEYKNGSEWVSLPPAKGFNVSKQTTNISDAITYSKDWAAKMGKHMQENGYTY